MKTTPKWMLGLVAMGALALAACGADVEHEAQAAAAPEVGATHTVASAAVEATVPVDGTVQARQRAEISTRMMARVSEVGVELGAEVRQGQPLVRLGLEDVEANRAKAEAAVAAARAARDEAERHAARMDTLLAADAVARVQRDQARLGLAQAESQVAIAEATLAEVETAASYARLSAPFDGVIVARSVDPGDMAAPGMPLLVVESAGAREAALSVPPEHASTLAAGSELRVATPDGRTTTGRVRAVAGGADPMTRTVEVRVGVPADWPSGSSVTAFLPTGARERVTIPADYVVRRGQLTGVRVVTDAGTVLRWVRLGRAMDDAVEVLSGLEAGEVIAR